MAFNHELAYKLTLDDRDTAPFFAGREAEQRSFADALKRAQDKPQAVFRVFQGAPGSGKTSLAAQLEKNHRASVLFVRPKEKDMIDDDSLVAAVRHAALKRTDRHSFALTADDILAGAMKRPEVAEKARQAFAGLVAKKFSIAIHIDEAHAMKHCFDSRLLELHTSGLEDRPCVVLLTGLGRTEERLLSISGLSRTSIESAVEMGALSEDECAESTRMMLNELGIENAESNREEPARLLAAFSHGWPQHLALAQKALCEELMRAGGELGHADFNWIKQRSDSLRARYYESRLSHPLFNRNKPLIRQIVTDVARRQPCSDVKQDFINMCANVIGKAGPKSKTGMSRADAEPIVDALIDKGVVSDRAGKWQLAIPSMGVWATNELRKQKSKAPAPLAN